jgi:exopolysaccharide biosynthesis polyprenyl glycosylphosphotransferase
VIGRRTLAFQLGLAAADAASAALLVALIATIVPSAAAVASDDTVLPVVAGLGWGLAWVAVLAWRGLYHPGALWTWSREARQVLAGAALLGALTLSGLYLADVVDLSRAALLALFPAQAALTLVVRGTLRGLWQRAGRGGERRRWLLVVGVGPAAQAFADLVEREPALAVGVVGHVRLPGEADRVSRPVLGDAVDLGTFLHSLVVDEVAVCPDEAAEPPQDLVEGTLAVCRDEGRIVRVPFRGDPPAVPGAVVERLAGQPLLTVLPSPDHALGMVVKRVVDVVLAAALLVLLAPLLVLIGVAVRLEGGPPAIFRQRRIGLHGRPFTLLKFRSMSPDAEERRAELVDHNEVQGRAFKLRDDPRLTRVGLWLRRTSLDELPQLWNVLRGEMSLVGPRPPLPEEVATYDAWHRRRLSVRPGMTGLWQVNGRHDPVFDRWVRLDLAYIDHWSLTLDLVILLRTIPVVVTLRGR